MQSKCMKGPQFANNLLPLSLLDTLLDLLTGFIHFSQLSSTTWRSHLEHDHSHLEHDHLPILKLIVERSRNHLLCCRMQMSLSCDVDDPPVLYRLVLCMSRCILDNRRFLANTPTRLDCCDALYTKLVRSTQNCVAGIALVIISASMLRVEIYSRIT